MPNTVVPSNRRNDMEPHRIPSFTRPLACKNYIFTLNRSEAQTDGGGGEGVPTAFWVAAGITGGGQCAGRAIRVTPAGTAVDAGGTSSWKTPDGDGGQRGWYRRLEDLLDPGLAKARTLSTVGLLQLIVMLLFRCPASSKQAAVQVLGCAASSSNQWRPIA